MKNVQREADLAQQRSTPASYFGSDGTAAYSKAVGGNPLPVSDLSNRSASMGTFGRSASGGMDVGSIRRRSRQRRPPTQNGRVKSIASWVEDTERIFAVVHHVQTPIELFRMPEAAYELVDIEAKIENIGRKEEDYRCMVQIFQKPELTTPFAERLYKDRILAFYGQDSSQDWEIITEFAEDLKFYGINFFAAEGLLPTIKGYINSSSTREGPDPGVKVEGWFCTQFGEYTCEVYSRQSPTETIDRRISESDGLSPESDYNATYFPNAANTFRSESIEQEQLVGNWGGGPEPDFPPDEVFQFKRREFCDLVTSQAWFEDRNGYIKREKFIERRRNFSSNSLNFMAYEGTLDQINGDYSFEVNFDLYDRESQLNRIIGYYHELLRTQEVNNIFNPDSVFCGAEVNTFVDTERADFPGEFTQAETKSASLTFQQALKPDLITTDSITLTGTLLTTRSDRPYHIFPDSQNYAYREVNWEQALILDSLRGLSVDPPIDFAPGFNIMLQHSQLGLVRLLRAREADFQRLRDHPQYQTPIDPVITIQGDTAAIAIYELRPEQVNSLSGYSLFDTEELTETIFPAPGGETLVIHDSDWF